MLPDVSDALDGWVTPHTVISVEQHTTDFVDDSVETPRSVDAMVQVARPDQLTPEQLDSSLEYISVYATSLLLRGEFIEYDSRRFKFVSSEGWLAYGFTHAIGEEVK